ncbi:uncharacterized protein LOC135487636 [Lineus longissimus]|uniref:uncharacterized protein LOC135487636 n=1 Tax=Lineus longissimus TaxID=88925 RepID=UPI002B4F7AAD
MLTSMQIKEEDEENWVKSSSSNGQSSPKGQKQSFPTYRHITIEEKPASPNGDVPSESNLPNSKHEEILKWSKSIPQTLDVEKKLKSSPKGGNNVKLFFLSNDGDLFSGGTSNLGVQGLKTSMPGARMCRSADPRLTRGTSGVGRRGTPRAAETRTQKPAHWGKDSFPRTPGRDPKISVNDMHQVTGNLVNSSIYYSAERKNAADSRSKGVPLKSAWGKEPIAVSAVKQENETKQTLQSASHSVLGNMRRQSQRSSGVMRPWTTSSRIGDHAECTRSLSNALLNVLTIDDCQLRHMYRERVRLGGSRARVGSSHSRRGSRPQSSKTESGIFDLKSVSSGTSERRRNNRIRSTEEALAEHMSDNTKGDYDLPPELLILLEEHVDYPSEAVQRGFAALLDKGVMNNTSRTGLYKYDKSCKRKLACGKGTDLFMRMKAMLRYHMLVDETSPSRLRMTKALKMHHGERYQESVFESETGRLENLTEVSDATE